MIGCLALYQNLAETEHSEMMDFADIVEGTTVGTVVAEYLGDKIAALVTGLRSLERSDISIPAHVEENKT